MNPTFIKDLFTPSETLRLGCDSEVIVKAIIDINLIEVSLVNDTIV